MSPDQAAWDNPFPTFPGTKKKTSVSEEQKIVQKMAAMEVGGQPQSRPRTAGSKNSQERYPRGAPTNDYGRPSMDSQRRGPSTDDYGRPSMDSQRSMQPRGYPPQQDPRRGPPAPGYGNPRQNGYADPGYDDRGYGGPVSPIRDNFGPPGRSMTMPNDPGMGMMPQPRQQPMGMEGPGPSAPYNGPIGRGMPPRPSTATGTRQPPQKQYPQADPYANGGGNQNYGAHQPNESISDFYDSYYDENGPQRPRPQSIGSEMPNFDAIPAAPGRHRRGGSIDEHIQPGALPQPQQTGYQQVKPIKSQPDFRGRAQPQAAVFEMVGDVPPVPNAYPQQGYPDDPYAPQNGQYNGQLPGNQRGPQGYGGYDDPAAPQTAYPPRSTSASQRKNGPNPGMAGLPTGPKSGFVGLPAGPSPQNGGMPRNNSIPQQTPSNADALPSHPPPVRAGLIPNSVANQANNKPAPVRNYNNISPGTQQSQSAQAAAPAKDAAPPPVTLAEIEQLKNSTRINPNDLTTQLLLARKLVEASEVLVPAIPDQRARNKAREKYIMDAHKLLKKLVAAQNPDAMFYLADCYGRGALGLETDNKEAFSLYQSAAKAGHAAAAYRTAVCCELGNEEGGGTRKDPLKAIQWYKRAAMLGDTPAMYKMGMIQLKGLLGQPKNPREAVGWLKRAAERADSENPHALHELGLLYEGPQGNDSSVVRDEAYSFSLFNQAADLGYKFSQFRLGCAFEYGLFNQPIDPRRSIMWYSRAAAQEEHQSELALSGWYLTGSEGVLQQSDTEAYLWARKAAMAGLAKAEYAMGYFTEVGIGSPANLEDAKRWYWRAAGTFPPFHARI